jgi:hypothetical protein
MSDDVTPPRRYLRDNVTRVSGWLHTDSADIIATLGEAQDDAGLAGNIAEIGIHHGRLFLLLALMARDGERAVALDLFEEQEKNVDGSGKGDRQRFEANIAAYAPQAPIDIRQGSSLDVDPSTATETFGHVRMFSIDGGHTEEIACHDLRVAEACLVPGGIVVLDDPIHPYWLGVLSGVVRYRASGGTLRAFAHSENKLYLTNDDGAAERYRAYLATHRRRLLGRRNVVLLGWELDTYTPSPTVTWRRLDADREKIQVLKRRIRRLRARVAELEASNLAAASNDAPASRPWLVAGRRTTRTAARGVAGAVSRVRRGSNRGD